MTIFVAALAWAVLLTLAQFPVNWGWLGWVAWVPFAFLVRSPRVPRLYLAAWAGFLLHFLTVLWWLSVANWFMTAAWVVLAVYGSLYVPLLLLTLRTLDRRTRWPLTVTLPVTLVVLEWVRGNLVGGMASLVIRSYQHDLPGGFAWYLLGHTQHDFLEAIQVADLGGAYLVTFVVAAVNGLLFEVLVKARRRYRPAALLLQGVCVLALLLATLGYGVWQTRRDTSRPGPTVALLQGSIRQADRDEGWRREGPARESQAEHYRRLCDLAWRSRPDLVVWPETSYPGYWQQERGGGPFPPFRRLAADILREIPTAHLLGMNTLEVGDGPASDQTYNSGIFLVPGQGFAGRYDKVHRVPFGEYVPLGDWLGFLRGVGPNSGEYGIAPGKSFPRFTLPTGERFGVLICYEDSVPGIAAAYLADPPVDFLVNISNDGWWDGTFGHDQHLAVCRFRAVECRRAVVRAVNMGISAMIDASGRVLAPEESGADHKRWTVPDGAASLPPARWKEFRVRPGVVVGRVPLDGRGSVYARWGDWLVLLCGVALVAMWWTRGPADEHPAADPAAA
ncbi:MAG: apolipoprotein N-acyltransferase [Gemmataceae bacterium]